MKLVYIYGTPGAGKTGLELNLRMDLDILRSEDKYPNKNGVYFYKPVLYKIKPRKNTLIKYTCEWLFKHPSIDELVEDIGDSNTFVFQGNIIPFKKIDMEKIKKYHDLFVFDHYITEKRNLKQIKNRRKLRGQTPRLDSKNTITSFKYEENLKKIKKYAENGYINYLRLNKFKSSTTKYRKVCETAGVPHKTFHRNIIDFINNRKKSYIKNIFPVEYIRKLEGWNLI